MQHQDQSRRPSRKLDFSKLKLFVPQFSTSESLLEEELARHSYQRKLIFDPPINNPNRPDGKIWTSTLHLNGVPAVKGHDVSEELARQQAARIALENIESGIWTVHAHELRVRTKVSSTKERRKI